MNGINDRIKNSKYPFLECVRAAGIDDPTDHTMSEILQACRPAFDINYYACEADSTDEISDRIKEMMLGLPALFIGAVPKDEKDDAELEFQLRHAVISALCHRYTCVLSQMYKYLLGELPLMMSKELQDQVSPTDLMENLAEPIADCFEFLIDFSGEHNNGDHDCLFEELRSMKPSKGSDGFEYRIDN